MSFRISGLDPAGFEHLFGLPDDELAVHGARRLVAETEGSMPDRIELRDARPGESVILVNHVHQPADTPFRSSHAVYVLEGGGPATRTDDVIPPALRTRLLSIRAFDAQDMMIDADVVQGTDAAELIVRLLADPRAAYLHAHYARRGCYAALIERRP
jgi:hypothetical protein